MIREWWLDLPQGVPVRLSHERCADLLARDQFIDQRRMPSDFMIDPTKYANDARWGHVQQIMSVMAARPDDHYGKIQITRAGQLGDGWHRVTAAALGYGATFTVELVNR